jgi:hypothetical protein
MLRRISQLAFFLFFILSVLRAQQATFYEMTNVDRANGDCSKPPAVNTFKTSDQAAYLVFNVTGVGDGDLVVAGLVTPSSQMDSDSVVGWGPLSAGNYCFTAEFDIAGQLPASMPGTWSVVAGDGVGGSTTNVIAFFSLNFTIETASPLSITGLSPTSANAGGPAFTLTVTGSGFVAGSVIQWNGTPLATNFVSGSQLTALVSASDIAAPGSYNISVLNLDGTLSNSMAFIVIPQPVFGGSMAQVASGGGWQTTFTLVNMGSASAQAQLSFFDNNGNALLLPLTLVQSGSTMTAAKLTQTIAAGASLVVLAQGSNLNAAVTGSAQLTAGGNVNGFAIFRYNPTGQEATVPLETRNAGVFLLAFDNTNGVSTGVALANVANQAANIPVVIHDDTGTQIGTDTIQLAARGHTSFMLTSNYASTGGKRGTIEFHTPPSGQITVLGLRANGNTLTTLPVLAGATTGGGSSAQLLERVAERFGLVIKRQ